MGKKSKSESKTEAAAEPALEPEVVEAVKKQVANQKPSALADGFAQSAAFFGKKKSYAVAEKETPKEEKKTDDKKKKEKKPKKEKKKQEEETEETEEKAEEKTDKEEEEAAEIEDGEKKKNKKKKKKSKKKKEEGEEEEVVQIGDEKSRRTVFVGNVSLDATQKDIKQHFSKCGKVENVRLRHLPIAGCAVGDAGNQKLMMKVCANKKILTTAKDNCNAYVIFADERSVEAALKLSGSMLVHKKIRVDKSDPVIDARRSVFIGNVPFKCSDEQMTLFFSKRLRTEEEPEPIENVRLIRDRESGLGKGFGYLLLKSQALVAKALSLRDLKMETRELRVQVCGKRFKNNRGEESEKEKFEGLRASAGARARRHLKRKTGDDDVDHGLTNKKVKRAAGLSKKLKPKHAARKAAKAAAEAAAATGGMKRKHDHSDSKKDKSKAKKPKHAACKAKAAADKA